MASTQIDKSLERRINQSVRTYNQGDPGYFDFFAKNASIFGTESSEPVRGRENYRKNFEKLLTSGKRRMKILRRDVQVVGTNVILSQTAQITQTGVTANVRQSAIWGQEDGEWVIEHLHTALIGAPIADKTPSAVREIRVLNERIATVAAVLGVAE